MIYIGSTSKPPSGKRLEIPAFRIYAEIYELRLCNSRDTIHRTLLESLDYAAQRMPRLKDSFVNSRFSRDYQPQGLTLCSGGFEGRMLSLSTHACKKTYEPSLRVLEAWKNE